MPLPLFRFEEEPDSRESSDDPPSITLHYGAYNEPDDAIVGVYASAALPDMLFTALGALYRQRIQLQPDGFARYKITAPYGTQKKDVGSFNFRFDTTGATIKIKAAKEHIKAFTKDGEDTDNVHQGAIGVTNDLKVEGCDIIVPALKLSYTFKHPLGIVNAEFSKLIASCTGKVSMNPFVGFDAGELLFAGGTGESGTETVASVTYDFIASENATSDNPLTIGGISNIVKDGHHFAWVEFKDDVVAGQPAVQPRRVNIERVYDPIDFASQFGWGVLTLAGEEYSKVTPGQKIKGSPATRAKFVNDAIDAIEANKRKEQGTPTETPTGAIWATDIIKVRNLTGSDRIRGDVVQLGDYLLDPLDWRNLWFEGNTVTDAAGKIAILRVAAKTIVGENPADIAIAQVSGICTANVNVTDVGHGYAVPVAGSPNLDSSADGPIRIQRTPTSTGVQEIPVLLAGKSIETRIVDVWDGSSAAGKQIGPTGGCIWPGRIMGVSGGGENFCSNPWTPTPTIGGITQPEIDIWITPIDNPGGSGTTGLKLTQGDRFIGRYLEDYTLSGTKKPLYAIRRSSGPLVRFELYTDLVFGVGTASAKLLVWDGAAWTATADVISVYDPFIAGGGDFTGKGPVGAAKGYQGWCQLQKDSGLYEIVYMEHKAQYIKGTLYQQLKYSDASQANCTMTDYWQGRNPDPAAANITITNEGQFYGPAGATFYAVWDDNDSKYNILWVQRQARFAYVTLTADMTAGSSASATVLTYWDGLGPGSTITVKDPQNFFRRALSGANLLVTFNETAAAGVGQYEVVEGQSQAGAIAVTLTANMSGGSATASLASSSGQAGSFGTQQDTQAPTGTITVYDPFGASGPFSIARSGAQGLAIFDNVAGKYWLFECERLAIMFTASLSADLHNADGTASVGSLTPASQWPFTQAPGSTPTVNNPRSHAGLSGDAVLIYRSGTTYNILDVAKHVVTVQTKMQYDMSGHKIQVKTQDLNVEVNGAESGWTDTITFTQITYTTAVSASDPTLSYHTHTCYVLQDADDTDHTVDTGTDCPP